MKISLPEVSNSVELEPIRIFIPEDLRGDCRVEICDSVAPAVEIRTVSSPYLKDSFIPIGPWRNLTEAEEHLLFCEEPLEQDLKLGLLRLPYGLPNSLEVRLEMGDVHQATMLVESSSRAFKPLVEFLESLTLPLEPLIVHGPKVDVPRLETVTVNPKYSSFIGLHLDSWDGSSDIERRQSRTRICVNLGPDLRSYLFVPYTLDSLAAALAADGQSEQVAHHSVHRALFARTRQVPVLRLTMGPKCAYFADTDRMIHDGSSALAKRRSVHFTVRGRFRRLRLA